MKLSIETTKENRDAIYSAIKDKYPDLEVKILIQKSFETVDLIQIGLSSAQVLLGIVSLIPVILPKNEPQIKVTIKDETKGRGLILEGNDINETKIVKEFIESLDK